MAPTEPVFSRLLDHGQREKLITVFLLAAPAFFVACPNPAAVYKVSASYRSLAIHVSEGDMLKNHRTGDRMLNSLETG